MIPWILSAFATPNTTLVSAFDVPHEASRIEADAFGTWLRTLKVADPDRPVTTFDGRRVNHRARVVELPMVGGDLQQCADSILRLRAEHQKLRGESVSYHATSGDPIPWKRWQAGERPYAKGNGLAWKSGTTGGWDAYLSKVFMWAGTRSLAAYETVPVDGPPAVGDVLVAPGSPGHAVILMDVATDTRGRTFVLVGEGYMPAQTFHIELGPVDGWWLWDGGVALPHWDLHGENVHRRFKPDR